MKYYVNVTAYYVLLGNSRFHYSEKHVLWNPSTRREMYIECPYAYNEAYKLNYGICYDRLTDDFKVVLVIDDRYAIYSCKNNSWSEKKLGIKYYGFFTGIFVDGATYWVLRDDKHTIQIVYFDPRTDELKGLQKPEQLNSDCNSGLTISVACLRENMCLYSVSGEGDDDMLRFRIWRKEKGIGAGGNPNWEELLTFEIRKPRDWWLGVLCFVENKILIRLDEKTFVYYSPTEKTFEEIDGNEAHNLYSTYCSELVRYRNSLYFPVQAETRSIS
ncbi:PREDICTED: uncharacterized protein LOC105963288 [Erythranthe guttata]|uniref:uncharacterized protein LOC105963288 n=1 Tax=Erythranthe guttata TaxID=4155 RepID=UPI00064D93D5|nr:PREDICTED: uncharacterized protein LOC105963288 [Erythranthe guttata]|eukprot:XP_012843135.1 PREDICTED: uncharacterized protein LOC105963288 [Erythranthe guttata]